MKLKEIIKVFESEAPLGYQEDYDNSGLAVGNPEMDVMSVLLCIDVTVAVIEEAIKVGANVVISHHPVIFSPLKRLTGRNNTEKIVIMAVQQNIALYSAHTNLDNLITGVNQKICQKLDLHNTKILFPEQQGLRKLVTYIPLSHTEAVRSALFEAGAGHVGRYDSCSFNTEGKGSFRALEGTVPFVGEIGKFHMEDEIRLETIFPLAKKSQVINALINAHPYEEVAYDIYPVENNNDHAGSGMTAELDHPMDEKAFLNRVKEVFSCKSIRHSQLLGKPIRKVAVCGGSGSFLISKAISSGADIFLTGDLKYHQFFDAEEQIVIADIGHYESEQFTIEIFYDILRKNLPNFAFHFSRINTSPIYYL